MHDLSGPWHGLYSYPQVLAPVFFTAELHHADPFLSGRTEESMEGGACVAARLSGRLAGQGVTFLKMYEAQTDSRDCVSYDGLLDPDGTEIHGRWIIPGNWSGTFLMMRASQAQLMLAQRWAARVPGSIGAR